MAKHYLEFRLELTDEEREYFITKRLGGAEVVISDDDENDGPTAATDKNGVAWSEKYHSNPPKQNADKTWRRRKNLSDSDKLAADAYEAAAPAPVAEPVVASVAPGVPAAPLGIPGIPVGIPGLPQPAAVVVPPPISYDQLLARFGELHAANPDILTHVQTVIYPQVGLTDVNALNTDETMRRKLFDALASL